MAKHKWLTVVGIAVLLVSVVLSMGAAPPGGPDQSGGPQRGHDDFRPPVRFEGVARPVHPVKPGAGPRVSMVTYTPTNVQTAYNFGSFADGSGQTIAILDAYGDPTLVADVNAFSSYFGLPLPGAKLNVVNVDGNPTSTDANWAIETALDVEWAHANAPNATIDLIVTPDASWQHLLDGFKYAAGIPGVAAISMSFGGAESYVPPGWESAFSAASSKGIILLAASGDQGAYNGGRSLSVNYPASSQYVIGVGGTTLKLSSSGGYGSETAWSYSGGGYSTVFTEPKYQTAARISDSKKMRGVPDVAFDADLNTGVYVYYKGWYSVGGTSVGAPNWAAIIADSAAKRALSIAYLYGTVYYNAVKKTFSTLYVSEIHDVKSGNNGNNGGRNGYNAGTGWDAVTGIGTPNVSNLILGR